jgi:hypothetical protein
MKYCSRCGNAIYQYPGSESYYHASKADEITCGDRDPTPR